jgi:hypothetical protein
MAEDSGAFKTIPANRRQILDFVAITARRCSKSSGVDKPILAGRRSGPPADF